MPELHEMPADPATPTSVANPPRRMTEEEFVAWCPEDVRAEWADGEVIVMSPSNTRHIQIEVFLVRLLAEFVEQRKLGQVLSSSLEVRLATQRRRRLPDISFVATGRSHLIKPTYFEGAPDLVVEIVSPDSVDRDRREKYLEYQAAGVREYWVIDLPSEKLEAFALSADGAYQRIEEQDGRVPSKILPGFYVRPSWMWQETLPIVREIFGEMGL